MPWTAVRARAIGAGCMRLSTDRDRDEDRAIAVLHAAFDAGVNVLDTADAYCRDETEVGHNERLIARALATWNGDRSRIRGGHQGGLTRPQGDWVADGRARHLAAACEASLRALGVERIQLYQLHAPDPRTPLATSLRALASLQRDGLIESIGLCNVNVGQIEEARRITEIASVQVELSIWHDESILSGVAEYCVANGIRLLAYRPLGGPQRRHRTRRDPTLLDVAARHGATPFEIALAWLSGLSDVVLPIPGPTRVETRSRSLRAGRIALTLDDRARLDERCPAGRALRLRETRRDPPAPGRADGEVVLIMGLPGAGKSTVAESFVAQGYTRLNRDEIGGSLHELLPALEAPIAAGSPRVVLDNTYVSRTSRAAVVQAAWQRALPVRCVWLSTSVEDAQVNVAWRTLSSDRGLDAAPFGPTVQFRYQRELEPPDPSEKFSRIDVVPFERRYAPSFLHRALIVWCDGVLVAADPARARRCRPTTSRCLPGAERCCVAIRRPGGGCWDCPGSQRSPRERCPPPTSMPCSHGCRSCSVSIEIEYLSTWPRAANLLVPKAAARSGRRVHSAPPSRRVAVHLRRRRRAGSGFARRLRFQDPNGGRLLRGFG